MIKCILFDFDGVLTIDKTGSTSITNYISQRTNIELDIIKPNYYKYNKKLLMGEINHEDMWEDFCNDVGEQIPYQVLIDSFKNTALDEKMFNYIKDLKSNYRIGMVTDNKVDRIEIILNHNHYEDYFDVVAISAKLHSGKEDSQIFQYVLNGMEVDATECIFIDNTAKNLLVPAKMGMRTIMFDDESRDFQLFVQNLNAVLQEEI
ncbi:MAG: HAD-IA family hydrolase [Lachnospiraceae bacterium]|nr:HAD-IA family hydrolase [Lachnospiraceae bacterium]